jgi:small subunit ribosomal protein S19e
MLYTPKGGTQTSESESVFSQGEIIMAVNEVYPNELVEKVAEELKKIEEIKPPVWATFVKTGVHKERSPESKDWWYTRAAAVLRSIFNLGPIGVSKLRTKYGGKQRRGHKKAHFKKGSGSVIRKILQQLEKAGLIKFVEKGIHKGRVIAPKGKSILDKTAAAISKTKPKKKVVKKEAPKEEPKAPVKKEEPKPEAPKEAPVKKEEPKKPAEAPKEVKAEKKEEAKPEATEEEAEEPIKIKAIEEDKAKEAEKNPDQ